MNEPKDDLLAAFENPESVSTEDVAAIQGTPVPESPAPVIPDVPYTPENTAAPEVPVAPAVPEAPVAPAPAPEAPVVPAQEVATENIMPAEFQNAPEATPIPEVPQAPVIPEAPASTQEVVAPNIPAPVAAPAPAETPAVAPAPEAPASETPAAEEGNQNVPEQVSEEPAVTVKNMVTPEQDDPNFLKKNLKFILIFAAVIALFIIFLPKILSLISGGSY